MAYELLRKDEEILRQAHKILVKIASATQETDDRRAVKTLEDLLADYDNNGVLWVNTPGLKIIK